MPPRHRPSPRPFHPVGSHLTPRSRRVRSHLARLARSHLVRSRLTHSALSRPARADRALQEDCAQRRGVVVQQLQRRRRMEARVPRMGLACSSKAVHTIVVNTNRAPAPVWIGAAIGRATASQQQGLGGLAGLVRVRSAALILLGCFRYVANVAWRPVLPDGGAQPHTPTTHTRPS